MSTERDTGRDQGWRSIVRWCVHGERPFWAVTNGTALFLLFQDGFYTLDGWAHAANARLMLARWADAPFLDGFVRFNPVPVPNWGGHALLALLMALFPPLLAEKVHWALLLLAFASGGRAFIKAWSGKTDVRALLLLPILLGGVFVLGFYNFLWGMAASLWCAAFWCAIEAKTFQRYAVLLVFTAIVWSCHGSCVPFFLALVLGIEGARPGPFKPIRVLSASLAFAPALLGLWYFNEAHEQHWMGFPFADLASRLVRMEWSVGYDGSREWVMSLALGCALLLGALVAVLRRANDARRRTWPFPAIGAVLLIAYFIIPDDTGYANYISLRIATALALVLALWAGAATDPPRWTVAAMAGLACIALFGKLRIMAREGAQACEDRDVLVRAALIMKPGDVVLPVWRDDRWLYQHRADVLGLMRPLRLLENSECGKRYFPLVWDPALPAAFDSVAHYADPCARLIRAHMRNNSSPRVDHIVFLGDRLDPGECAVSALLTLADTLGYTTSFSEADVRVLTAP